MITKYKISQYIAILAIMNCSPACASEIPATVLKQSSAWQVNYTPDECQLYRYFGTGDDRILFRMSVDFPNINQRFLLIGKRLPIKSKSLPISITLNDAAPVKFEAYSYNLSKNVENILEWWGNENTLLKSSDTPQNLNISSSKLFNYDFEIGKLNKAMEALDTCQDELWKTYGIDPKIIRDVAQQPIPKGNRETWVTTSDYPKDLLRKNVSGIVTFLLKVDQEGRPSDCAIVKSSGNAVLDKRTRVLMLQRARFTPAQNTQNQPIISAFYSRVRWMTPG